MGREIRMKNGVVEEMESYKYLGKKSVVRGGDGEGIRREKETA